MFAILRYRCDGLLGGAWAELCTLSQWRSIGLCLHHEAVQTQEFLLDISYRAMRFVY